MGKQLGRKYVIRENTVTCQICGKTLKMVNQAHLNKHNIDYDTYRKNYPAIQTVCLKSLRKWQRNQKKRFKKNKKFRKTFINGSKKCLTNYRKNLTLKDKKELNKWSSTVKKEMFKKGLIIPSMLGKHISEEQKIQMSEARKGMHFSPETEFKPFKIEVTCKNCGKTFLRIPYKVKLWKNHFCSKECRLKFQKKKVSVKCENCSKVFEKSRCEFLRYKHHYCSNKCWLKAIRTKKRRRCENCKKIVLKHLHDIKRTKHNFCSRKCFAEYRRNANLIV